MPREDMGSTDAEALAFVRATCLALPGTEEAELQGRPLFRVGRRRYALFNGDSSPPRPRWAGSGRSLHVLADPFDLDALHADDRFEPSPHHGDRGWVAVRLDDGRIGRIEVAELLDAAHRQVRPAR